MNAKFFCPLCGKSYELNTREYKCICGGAFMLDFCAPKYEQTLVDENRWNLFRYEKFLPNLQIDYNQVSLGEGMSPIVAFEEDALLKMDYFMPTLSFKDRGAVMVMALCKSIGVSKVLQDSSGNAGNSIAAYAARCGIECEIYVPEGTSRAKIDMIKAHGACVNIVNGTRDETADACRNAAQSGNAYYASHVFNPLFYQGTKTYIYEAFEQIKKLPENIFIPVGNGTLFLGTMIGLYELLNSGVIDELPNIIAVQSEMCDPLFKAYLKAAHTPENINPSSTLAEGIAIAKPIRGSEILDYIYKANARVVIAPEEDILTAQNKLARNGFFVEHTTAATYAAYEALKSAGSISGQSLIPLCGAGLKSIKS